MHSFYKESLRWALNHPRLMLGLIMVAIVINIVLFIFVPKGFFPEQDTGRISGSIQADQDTSFQSMRVKMADVVDIVRADPNIESVTAYSGGGTGTNNARMFIALKPFGERKATATQVIARLRGKLAQIPGAPTYLQSVQDIRVGGRMSGSLYQYTLQGTILTSSTLGGASAAKNAFDADTGRCQQRSAGKRASGHAGHGPPHGSPVRHHPPDHGRGPLRCFRAKPGFDHLYAPQPISCSHGGGAGVLAKSRHSQKPIREFPSRSCSPPECVFEFPARCQFAFRKPPGPIPRPDTLFQPASRMFHLDRQSMRSNRPRPK